MIKNLIEFQNKLINGDLPVQAGQNETLSPAASVGDFFWQGDLKFTVINFNDFLKSKTISITHPDTRTEDIKYTEIQPKEEDKQLVPGNTIGAKHCLEHLNVRYFVPEKWSRNESYDSLFGPVIYYKTENKILHNEHGIPSIPKDMCILNTYQRNLDQETKRETRARD